jgi:hypothetical protein
MDCDQSRQSRKSSRLRTLGLLCLVLCFYLPSQAEEPARITFSFDFPGSDPDHYVISTSADGPATYDSHAKTNQGAEGDSFHFDFTIGSSTRTRIFDLAKRAHYFEGDVDSKKRGMASTGIKTLKYVDAQRSTQASYNYSRIPAVQEVTDLLQKLSTTLEFGRRLEYDHHYQKLALDEELKRMEEMAKQDGLEELSAVSPILQRIAADASVINPVRVRAQRLIAVGRKESP